MKKSETKRALLLSVLSVVLCLAMFMGSTFAWFTDSVSTGVNKIVAGNLDVELEHKSASVPDYTAVDSNTKLFVDSKGDLIEWEPGVIAYENFKVKNVGSLALQFNMSISVGSYNTVGGKPLKDVLKVAISESEFSGDRAAAQNLTYDGTVESFEKNGVVLPRDEEKTYSVVIYWEPSASDNDYNLNNGRKADDGASALYIDLGVNLVATQTPSEYDSFGDDYDAAAVYPAIPAVVSASASGTIAASGSTTIYDTGSAETATVSAAIPAGTLKENDTVALTVERTALTGDSVTYEIALAVNGEKPTEALTNPVTVTVNIGAGLKDVTVTHNGAAMTKVDGSPTDDQSYSYDAVSGVLTIVTKTFSPFEIAYQADFAAKIGNTGYATLDKAIYAAKTGDTIILLKDVNMNDLKNADGGPLYQVSNRLVLATDGVTIDLAQHTLTVYNHTLTLTGENVTVKNGSIVATPSSSSQTVGSYAVAVGGKNVTLENLTTIGGVSVNGYDENADEDVIKYPDALAVIKNCDITDTNYYAVCAQGNGDAYISDSVLRCESGKATFWIENDQSSITYDNDTVTITGSLPLYMGEIAPTAQ